MIGLLYLHSGTPLTDFWPFSCGVELTAVSFKTSMDMTRTRPHARTHELFFYMHAWVPAIGINVHHLFRIWLGDSYLTNVDIRNKPYAQLAYDIPY